MVYHCNLPSLASPSCPVRPLRSERLQADGSRPWNVDSGSVPLVFAGGPTATSNPEPFSDFCDYFALVRFLLFSFHSCRGQAWGRAEDRWPCVLPEDPSRACWHSTKRMPLAGSLERFLLRMREAFRETVALAFRRSVTVIFSAG